jgi:hypothetical protein
MGHLALTIRDEDNVARNGGMDRVGSTHAIIVFIVILVEIIRF